MICKYNQILPAAIFFKEVPPYLKQRGKLKLTKKALLLSRDLAGDTPGKHSKAVPPPTFAC